MSVLGLWHLLVLIIGYVAIAATAAMGGLFAADRWRPQWICRLSGHEPRSVVRWVSDGFEYAECVRCGIGIHRESSTALYPAALGRIEGGSPVVVPPGEQT